MSAGCRCRPNHLHGKATVTKRPLPSCVRHCRTTPLRLNNRPDFKPNDVRLFDATASHRFISTSLTAFVVVARLNVSDVSIFYVYTQQLSTTAFSPVFFLCDNNVIVITFIINIYDPTVYLLVSKTSVKRQLEHRRSALRCLLEKNNLLEQKKKKTNSPTITVLCVPPSYFVRE